MFYPHTEDGKPVSKIYQIKVSFYKTNDFSNIILFLYCTQGALRKIRLTTDTFPQLMEYKSFNIT